ncbi:MAG: tyrosine-type recombinase/integrase [Ktedonobacteraceae bacterium]|nr:tyrosine-type recombinase/integrase [Ktedonobacteraceae bacterium]
MKQSRKRRGKHSENVSSSEIVQAGRKREKLSLDDALHLFLLSRGAAGYTDATKKDYKVVIGLFLRYIRETYQYSFIEDVTETNILEWLAYLQGATSERGRPFSSRSIETYSTDVSIFFNWLFQHKHISVNPMSTVKHPKVEKTLFRLFTEDELKALDTACGRAAKGKALTEDERKALTARDRAFLWLLLSTGIRVSEACGLLFSDIDWKEEMIYVQGKGKKERRIPFGKVAKQHLDTYVRYWRGEPFEKVRPDDHVFLGAFGGPLTSNTAWRIFARLKQVAGITDKRVSPHTCRHWFAVNAIKRGMPTVVLKDILGHGSWDMIEIYVRLAEQDLKESYTQFSPVDALDMHRYPKGRRAQLRDWRNSRKRNT